MPDSPAAHHSESGPEGDTLTTTETPEATPSASGENETPEKTYVAHTQDTPEAHEHEHAPAQPSLNPECAREVEVDLSADEVAKAFRTVLKKYQKLARIPGFRPGKVPESVLRSRFLPSIREEVVEAVVPQHFREAIAKTGERPVSQPQVTDLQLEEGKPLHFKAVFGVRRNFPWMATRV